MSYVIPEERDFVKRRYDQDWQNAVDKILLYVKNTARRRISDQRWYNWPSYKDSNIDEVEMIIKEICQQLSSERHKNRVYTFLESL